MRVREIRYERLFNLRNYNNERIGVAIELDEGESEAEALGKAMDLVYRMHLTAEAARRLFMQLGDVSERIPHLCEQAERLRSALAELEAKYNECISRAKEIAERLARGEKVEDLKTIECEIPYLEKRIEEKKRDLKHVEDEIKKLTELKRELERELKQLYERLRRGELPSREEVPELLEKVAGLEVRALAAEREEW
ncbi:MAG: hypothetical protein DRJ67_01445 [Thermoprotei archaeon]|nr:MAG: hypothetical protein DRJ67_01445 [Thermoprotei archaeon]